MAKKEPTIQDAVDIFMTVLTRIKATGFRRNNRVLYVDSDKCNNILLIPDVGLWNVLSEDQDINEMTRELNPAVDTDKYRIQMTSIGDKMDEEWMPIDDAKMSSGEIIYIKMDGFDYDIEINNTIFPLRFKKAEFGDFSYRIFNEPFHSFVIRKKFVSPINDASFYIVRVFRII